MAQDDTLPSPPGQEAWRHTLSSAASFSDLRGFLVLPDGQGGTVLVGNTATRRDATGRLLWSHASALTWRPYGVRGIVADGSLWLAIPTWQAPEPGKPATVTLAQFAVDDGRLLQQRMESLPRDARALRPDEEIRLITVVPRADGAVVLVGIGSSGRGRLWLGWRDLNGNGWDLPMEDVPARDIHGAQVSLNRGGGLSLLVDAYPNTRWHGRVSRDGRGSPWQALPSTINRPLLIDGTLAYVEEQGWPRTSGSTLKMRDLATDKTTTVRAAIPLARVFHTKGAVELVDITADGAFMLQAPWRSRKIPYPGEPHDAVIVSHDGLKGWHLPLRVGDRVVDSRSVLRIDPARSWQDCPEWRCAAWQLSLVTYAP